ncbi:GNAT family N-acetyltransferase [Cellulomonas marina]|uniref:Acetyltransferase (GNAT) family protein n=1 Tax=Cellulomonas marina TaxID=988821 RepID=A0A1I0YAZ2_9CELL|nr:GNAT family N-acetyltransferase [Cellulomonas marina]GIG29627.1 hypothetical protein Cma02nite_22270 [Cellulomonas marina]SFB10441.1 hypothetical protein SAMN05421867_10720 [Cellulomonas marina]
MTDTDVPSPLTAVASDAPDGVRVVPVPTPASLDAPDAWLLHGLTAAMNEVVEHETGLRDHAVSPLEVLARLQQVVHHRRVRLVALADDPTDRPDPARVLGYATAELPLTDNTTAAALDLGVRPGHRGRAIGEALHVALLEAVVAEGRTVLMVSTDQRDEPGDGPDALAPPTGSGHVRRSSPGVRFALAHGYVLEQVARYSALDLPVPDELLTRLHDEARAAAGPDYRVVAWDGPCPDRWLDDLAVLYSRMSTDDPSAGLQIEEERWDRARIRVAEAQWERAGRLARTVAAEHVPTGRLVAFTTVITRGEEPVAEQEDTLVLAEHRGRRLGMLVKTEQLLGLARERPSVRRIGTWNAEENRFMLGINVALGFRPAGGSGEWQRILPS